MRATIAAISARRRLETWSTTRRLALVLDALVSAGPWGCPWPPPGTDLSDWITQQAVLAAAHHWDRTNMD
ncbi:hypothetical protein ABH935_006359 [Catenulispora sp. GAS73]